MLGDLVHKLLKKSDAPEWFCADKKRKTPEDEIKAKIRASIEFEINARGYDKELWNEVTVNKMTLLYYKFFNQVYIKSA